MTSTPGIWRRTSTISRVLTCFSIRQPSAYVSIRQHTSAYLDNISRGARYRRHNGSLSARQRVEQGAFAGIRWAGEDDLKFCSILVPLI